MGSKNAKFSDDFSKTTGQILMSFAWAQCSPVRSDKINSQVLAITFTKSMIKYSCTLLL